MSGPEPPETRLSAKLSGKLAAAAVAAASPTKDAATARRPKLRKGTLVSEVTLKSKEPDVAVSLHPVDGASDLLGDPPIDGAEVRRRLDEARACG